MRKTLNLIAIAALHLIVSLKVTFEAVFAGFHLDSEAAVPLTF